MYNYKVYFILFQESNTPIKKIKKYIENKTKDDDVKPFHLQKCGTHSAIKGINFHL